MRLYRSAAKRETPPRAHWGWLLLSQQRGEGVLGEGDGRGQSRFVGGAREDVGAQGQLSPLRPVELVEAGPGDLRGRDAEPGEQGPAGVDPAGAAQETQGAGIAVVEVRWRVAQEVGTGPGAVGVVVQVQGACWRSRNSSRS